MVLFVDFPIVRIIVRERGNPDVNQSDNSSLDIKLFLLLMERSQSGENWMFPNGHSLTGIVF